MERRSYIMPVFIAHCAMLVMFMAAPASVMSQTITITTIEQLQDIGNNARQVIAAELGQAAFRSYATGSRPGETPLDVRRLPS